MRSCSHAETRAGRSRRALGEPRGGACLVAEVLEQHRRRVIGRHRIRHGCACTPEIGEHLELVGHPVLAYHVSAAASHLRHGSAVAAVADRSRFAIADVVAERRGPGESERFELALRTDGLRSVPLLGEKVAATAVCRHALDDAYLGFLAGLEGSEVGVDVVVDEDPRGDRSGHCALQASMGRVSPTGSRRSGAGGDRSVRGGEAVGTGVRCHACTSSLRGKQPS